MMLDFPDNPNEGDTHTEKGQTWTFINGAWVVTPPEPPSADAEFHDPTGVASWRITGTTLECWGEEQVSQIGDGAITAFPKTFARPPSVSATPKAKAGGQAVRTLTIQETTTTQFEHWTTYINGNTADPLDRISWHAIGEWDGVS